MNKLLSFLVLILMSFALQGQDLHGSLLFRTVDDFNVPAFESHIRSISGERSTSITCRPIFRSLNLFVADGLPPSELENWKNKLETIPGILWMEEDRILENRYIPNDTYFDQQWHLEQISVVETWNIARGGLTPNGDTIVLAILDDGFFPQHSDLIENIWTNNAEIPGDGIDNDNNGYIDDYQGLNVLEGNDDHTVKEHGTAVAGIAGSRGDNEKGTTGVNMSVKMMLISEINKVSRVIEGYQYVLDMRTLYNQSDGQQGAYVVATNLSAGINGVFPDDSPIYQQWCAIYDKLGAEGVLNVNATTNNDVNIDESGDMPGTCTSEYLIVVTNSNRSDEKVEDAGYGIISVDIAAPGTEIYTTTIAEGYARFDGASSSAPQVTGVIGLLYNAPCKSFADLAKENPATGAMQVKAMILQGVDEIGSLQSVVRTGGRLNALSAISKMREFCEGTTGELEIFALWPNPANTHFYVSYQTENYELHEFVLHNAVGQTVFKQDFYPNYFGDKIYDFVFENLYLESGIYFASIISDSGIQTVRLLIVAHEE
jgi:hypothetical protein